MNAQVVFGWSQSSGTGRDQLVGESDSCVKTAQKQGDRNCTRWGQRGGDLEQSATCISTLQRGGRYGRGIVTYESVSALGMAPRTQASCFRSDD